MHTPQEIAAYSFQAAEGSFTTEKKSTVVPRGEAAETVKIEHGLAFVREEGIVTAYSLDCNLASDPGSASAQIDSQSSSLKENEGTSVQTSTSVEPDKVTVQDIKRYEALMKGKAVSAVSNAHAPRGLADGRESSLPLYKRHSWIADGEDDFGPMQVKFESAANLISLNIDLTFSCTDPARLLSEREAQSETVAPSSLVAEDTARIEGSPVAQRQDDALKNLGQFTIKGVESLLPSEDARKPGWSQQARPSSGQLQGEGAHYLPLIVHKHKGAQFNSSH